MAYPSSYGRQGAGAVWRWRYPGIIELDEAYFGKAEDIHVAEFDFRYNNSAKLGVGNVSCEMGAIKARRASGSRIQQLLVGKRKQ